MHRMWKLDMLIFLQQVTVRMFYIQNVDSTIVINIKVAQIFLNI